MKEGISINKLLIVGSGGHGRCCLDIALVMKEFDTIAFLDDHLSKPVHDHLVIGTISKMDMFYPEYQNIFIAIGNHKIRKMLLEKAKAIGFRLINLISPSSLISDYAKLDIGIAVFPRAVINASACIGAGCIISSNAVVDHDAKVEQYCHINALAVVPSMACVKAYTKVDYGQVYINKEENDDWKKEYEKQFGSEPSFF